MMTPTEQDPVSRPIFRASFSGSPLEIPTIMATLDTVELRYEGSEFDPADPPDRHRVLVGAADQQEAIGIVRETLAPHGAFGDFHAEPIRDLTGALRRTPIRRWSDIDWEEVQRKATLSELQRAVLGALLNDHETTWIIVGDSDVRGDRVSVEAALRDLEASNLVDSRRSESGEAGRESAAEDWWALTDEGWDLLGLIMPPRYR